MKKTVILSAILVLALSLSAAAEVKYSGKVWFKTADLLADEIAWDNGYRLQFSGSVSDNAGVNIRFENGKIDTDLTAGKNEVAVATVLKRANYYAVTPVGKVVAGLQFEDLSGISYNYAGSNMSASFTGVGFYPTIAEGVTAFGFYNPAKKQFGAQAKGSVAGATVWGGVSKADADDDAALSVGASYPVVADVATVYGQYDAKGDVKEEFVGVTGALAGIDYTAELALESELLGLDFTKTLGGVEFNAGYEKAGDAEGTLYFGTTVYF